ncbi:MAG: methyltransferase domain-containing protein [Planctomycetota bacterium]
MTQGSHGRLGNFELASNRELAGVPTWDLGCALLARLRNPDEAGSQLATEARVALLEALREAIDKNRDIWQNPFAVGKSATAFRFFRHCHRTHQVPFRGATWVDLGCGAVNPFVRLFPVLLLGARRVLCLELEPPRDLAKAARFVAELVSTALIDPARVFGDFAVDRRELLANVADFDLARLAAGDAGGLPPARCCLRQESVVATKLDAGSADVLVSNSLLEHLPDVDQALAEFARVTAPGGFGIHGIDTMDHRSYGDPAIHPLEFLTIPFGDRIVHECNRLRLAEFEALFARHGFDVVDQWRGACNELPASLRARLVAPWRDQGDDHLAVTWSQYLVRKRR